VINPKRSLKLGKSMSQLIVFLLPKFDARADSYSSIPEESGRIMLIHSPATRGCRGCC